MIKNSVDDFSATVHELRGSLAELLSTVSGEATRPHQLSRTLGLDKSLARKVARIVDAADPGEVVQNLPGQTGFNILLSAAERSGATEAKLARARDAIRSMDGVVERHFGDRPALEIYLDALPTTRDRLLLSRKLSFRGDSGIWGVQAKTRVNTAIIAPSARDPELIDSAAIGGWIDFRRVRADARWAIFRRWTQGSSAPDPKGPVPLDPDEARDGPLLLRKFCSENLPPIDIIADPRGEIVHEIGPSPIGNVGAFTLFSGWFSSGIGERYADAPDSEGYFGAVVSAPVETLVFDFLVHRDLEFATDTRVGVYGGSNGPPNPRDLLPLAIKPMSLGNYPPVVDTPYVPRYAEVVEYAFGRCGWDRRDFIGMRFILEYPPFPSTVRISFPLEKRKQQLPPAVGEGI